MSTRWAEFVSCVRSTLLEDGGAQGRRVVIRLLEALLRDREFTGSVLADDSPQVKLLHHDPEVGFSIFGHVFLLPERIPPHDHGPTWAIYGQAAGTTVMGEWEVLEAPRAHLPGRVRLLETHRLEAGQVRLYAEGAVHSLRRDGPAKLIRIEGQPFARALRSRYVTE